MSGTMELRGELEALLEALAKADDAPAATRLADAVDNPPPAELEDYGEILKSLSDFLRHRADEAEAVLSAHPFAAVSAAFMLGVAVGRQSR